MRLSYQADVGSRVLPAGTAALGLGPNPVKVELDLVDTAGLPFLLVWHLLIPFTIVQEEE